MEHSDRNRGIYIQHHTLNDSVVDKERSNLWKLGSEHIWNLLWIFNDFTQGEDRTCDSEHKEHIPQLEEEVPREWIEQLANAYASLVPTIYLLAERSFFRFATRLYTFYHTEYCRVVRAMQWCISMNWITHLQLKITGRTAMKMTTAEVGTNPYTICCKILFLLASSTSHGMYLSKDSTFVKVDAKPIGIPHKKMSRSNSTLTKPFRINRSRPRMATLFHKMSRGSGAGCVRTKNGPGCKRVCTAMVCGSMGSVRESVGILHYKDKQLFIPH